MKKIKDELLTYEIIDYLSFISMKSAEIQYKYRVEEFKKNRDLYKKKLKSNKNK